MDPKHVAELFALGCWVFCAIFTAGAGAMTMWILARTALWIINIL
jgi:hypothetical protein